MHGVEQRQRELLSMKRFLGSCSWSIMVTVPFLVALTSVRSQTVEILHHFIGDEGGSSPRFGVTFGDDGDLYGVTNSGGEYGYGTAFRIGADGTSYTILHSFDWGYQKMGARFPPFTHSRVRQTVARIPKIPAGSQR